MEEIKNLSEDFHFKILEDASHAVGSKYKGVNIGSCHLSDLCVFSFHPVKIITSGEGGMVTTSNDELLHKLESLRTHGIIRHEQKFIYEKPVINSLLLRCFKLPFHAKWELVILVLGG